MNVQVLTKSPLITDNDLNKIILFINQELENISDFIGINSHLNHYDENNRLPTIVLTDSFDFKDPEIKNIYSIVNVKYLIENGVQIFTGSKYSVLGILFHDVVQCITNPYSTFWTLTKNGFYFRDPVGPVIGDSHNSSIVFPKSHSLVTATLPDVLLPCWEDPHSFEPHYTIHKTIVRALEYSKNGYLIRIDSDNGSLEILFGSSFEPWFKDYISKSLVLKKIILNFPTTERTITEYGHSNQGSYDWDEMIIDDADKSPKTPDTPVTQNINPNQGLAKRLFC